VVTGSLYPLAIRKRLGPDEFGPPREFGPDGWLFHGVGRTVIVSVAPWPGHGEWVHGSVARPNSMPTYDDLVLLHHAALAGRFAIQVFSPPEEHINLHEYALHLWARLDGTRPSGLPNFGALGSV
jgi:hypothetical protein